MSKLANGDKFLVEALVDCSCDGFCNNTSSSIGPLDYVMTIPAGLEIAEVLTLDGQNLTGLVVGTSIIGIIIEPNKCLALNILLNVTNASLITECPFIVHGELLDEYGYLVPGVTIENFSFNCITCDEVEECFSSASVPASSSRLFAPSSSCQASSSNTPPASSSVVASSSTV